MRTFAICFLICVSSALSAEVQRTLTLPKSADEIDAAASAIRRRLSEITEVSERFTDSHEEKQLYAQWTHALDQHWLSLKDLKELRQARRDKATARPPIEPSPAATIERLTDDIAAAKLEFQTSQMLISILEGEIARHSASLEERQKEARRAHEDFEQRNAGESVPLHAMRIAKLRADVEAAILEAAEIGRLVACEGMETCRSRIESLEQTLSASRSSSRLTARDLEAIIAQIAAKRADLRRELEQATADEPLTSNEADDLQQARAETRRQRIGLLRGFIQLADYAETVWHDRLWATAGRTLTELRERQQTHAGKLESFRQWKPLIEQSLAAASDQILRQTLRAEDATLEASARIKAGLIRATYQERVAMDVRALGVLLFTEDLHHRLDTELTAQIAHISTAKRIAAFAKRVFSRAKAIWNAELYIAEDSAIVGGQKVSIPRAITLGKVIIGLFILGVGILAGIVAYSMVKRLKGAELPARGVATLTIAIFLFTAMASVRIPWTVFAFMGGALAIGVGFGAQTLINNFISGVILLCEQNIRVGDIIEVDEQRGKVTRVGLRNSVIARSDGTEALIPNSQFLEKKVVNWTLTTNLVRHEFNVCISYGSSPDKAIELIHQALLEHPDVEKESCRGVFLEDFGENGFVISLQFWVRLCSTLDGRALRSAVRRRIHTLFIESGIQRAMPQKKSKEELYPPPEDRGDTQT